MTSLRSKIPLFVLWGRQEFSQNPHVLRCTLRFFLNSFLPRNQISKFFMKVFLCCALLVSAPLKAEEAAPISLIPEGVGLDIPEGQSPSVEGLAPFKQKKDLPKDQYIQRGLDKIKFPLGSAVLTEVLQRLVLERITPEDPVFITGQKLKILYNLGRFQAVIKHLPTIPEDKQSNQLMKNAFISMCFQPNLDARGLHKISHRLYSNHGSPFWQQASTYSEALMKNTNRAELSMNVMRDHETGEGSQFLKLMESLLYGQKVNGFKRPSLLELAVARSAKVKVPGRLLEMDSLPMIVAVVYSESLPLEQRILAAEKALDHGAIEPRVLIDLYKKASFNEELVVEAQMKKGVVVQKLSPHMKRALLYKAALQSAGERRAEILHSFWKLDNGIAYESLAAASYPLLKELVPDEDLGWFAPEAFKALSLFTQNEYTKAWAAYAEQESPEMWLGISPFVYLSTPNPTESVDSWFERWYHVTTTRDTHRAKEKALLLANLLNAVGKPLKKHTLRDLEIAYNSESHPGILDSMYSKSQEGRSVEEVIISASKKMSKTKTQKDWIRLSQVVGKLRQFGLHKEASRLAVEIAMKNHI